VQCFAGGRESETLQCPGDGQECPQHCRDVRQIHQNHQSTGKGLNKKYMTLRGGGGGKRKKKFRGAKKQEKKIKN